MLFAIPWHVLASESELNERFIALEEKIEILSGHFEKEIKEKNIEISKLQERNQLLESYNQVISKEPTDFMKEDNFHENKIMGQEIRFIASCTSGGYIPTGIITFDKEVVDNSNNFDIGSGKFVAPQTGSYWFQFNSRTDGVYAQVDVYVNGNMVKNELTWLRMVNEDVGYYRQLNFF